MIATKTLNITTSEDGTFAVSFDGATFQVWRVSRFTERIQREDVLSLRDMLTKMLDDTAPLSESDSPAR